LRTVKIDSRTPDIDLHALEARLHMPKIDLRTRDIELRAVESNLRESKMDWRVSEIEANRWWLSSRG
jgi:hypothetical protein